MIKKIIRFILLLDNQTKKKFLVLILFVFLGSIVEIFSFGSIMPIFDIIINEKNSYLSKYDLIREFINSFENKLKLLLYLTFFISIIFILKNLYLIFLTWFSAKFTNDVRIYFNSLYVNQILINPYSYHLKNDSSKIIRDSMGEVAAVTKSMIFPTILITLDLITFVGLVILISLTNFEASMLIFVTLILFGFCNFEHLSCVYNYKSSDYRSPNQLGHCLPIAPFAKCIPNEIGCSIDGVYHNFINDVAVSGNCSDFYDKASNGFFSSCQVGCNHVFNVITNRTPVFLV